MKGDFTRLTFRPSEHYGRVLLQQGRVQLDADWNEQMAIQSSHLERETADIIGACGSPAGERGFQITVRTGFRFSAPGQSAVPGGPEAFDFAERRPFALEAWVCPSASGGPVLSNASKHGGYTLSITSDLRVCFERCEIEHHVETETVVDDVVQIGRRTVIVLEEEQADRKRRVRHIVESHRRLEADQYSHIAVVFDGRVITVNINGEPAARSKAGVGAHSAAPFRIGAKDGGTFTGEIADVRIWDHARSAAEIHEHLHWLPPGDHHHLIAWYRFEESQGATAADFTGHGHDAQLEGSPAWVRDLWIERGRYYVEGALCINERDVRFTSQPDYPASLPSGGTPAAYYLVYLDVWDRLITALEDPSIRDTALGGPDTAVRVKTVWQAKLLPLGAAEPSRSQNGVTPAWRDLTRSSSLALRARLATADASLDNQLYRVEIHNGASGGADGETPFVTATPAAQPGWWSPSAWQLEGRTWAMGDTLSLSVERADGSWVATGTATLAALDASQHLLQLTPTPPDNPPQVRLARAASFKWSRENGSVVFPVTFADPANGEVQLGASAADLSRLSAGAWVELGDDDSVLLDAPWPLVQVTEIDPLEAKVKLAGIAQSGIRIDPARHAYLRRWDQTADAAASGVVIVQSGAWIGLESGIQVQFQAGSCRPGDYWVIPSRTDDNTDDAQGGIEWPLGESGPLAQPPLGIRHRYCPLALIAIDHLGPHFEAGYRRSFFPLTEVTREEGNFVKRTGDEMSGPLVINSSLRVARHVDLPDVVDVGLLRGHLERDIVGTDQIRDRTVTREKLAFPIDPVPPGFCLLRESPDPMPGFGYTGPRLVIANPEPRWSQPRLGRGEFAIAAVALDQHIFMVTGSGSTWLFEPATGHLQERRPLDGARRGFALVSIHGKVFVMGGIGEDDRITGRLSEYDLGRDAWQERRPMPTPRWHLAAAVARGKIYAMGGDRSRWWYRGRTRRNEEYDPGADVWARRADLPGARSVLALGSWEGSLFAIGGERGVFFGLLGARTVHANDCYDPLQDVWMRRERLPEALGGIALGQLDGRFCVLGGHHAHALEFGARQPQRPCYIYDPSVDAWWPSNWLTLPRDGASAVTAGNTLYAVGGTGHAARHRPILPVAAVYYVFQRESEA